MIRPLNRFIRAVALATVMLGSIGGLGIFGAMPAGAANGILQIRHPDPGGVCEADATSEAYGVTGNFIDGMAGFVTTGCRPSVDVLDTIVGLYYWNTNELKWIEVSWGIVDCGSPFAVYSTNDVETRTPTVPWITSVEWSVAIVVVGNYFGDPIQGDASPGALGIQRAYALPESPYVDVPFTVSKYCET